MIGGMRIDDNGMGEAMDQFLRRTNFKDSYSAAVGDKSRFNIDLDQLRDFDPKLTQYIIKNPVKGIQLFEDRVNKLLSELNDNISSEKAKLINPSNFPVKCKSLKLNFDGNYGKNFVTPRGLKSSMINSLVKVQGIVTRMSIVKPKLSKSYHYIPATKQGYVQEYKDQYSVEGQGNFSSKLFPTKDAAGNLMVAEYGYCNYTDVQKLIIQEMPERTPTGQIPRSVMVFLEDDLVDRVKPGDRVEITGVFKCVSTASSSTSGVFKTIVVGTGIKAISDKSDKIKITPEDIKNIKYVSTRKDIFGVLASSIAPTVQGHINIKKSMILQLMGGTEKNLQDGGHLRGDINILLIGDPSTAKSQMLRHALNLAPIAINTTGRGSSGVGLTAAVTIDKETGERHLEAGAMVLADKGLVCIDEFDKMDDGDRVAIHEVMEQQTVTIAKAGIHASLNARCSVIAAANPIYGDYDRTIPAAKNIGLSDTLLSRFDLLFVVLDEKNPTVDKKIAERVIRNHTFKDENKGFVFNLFQDEFHIEPELPNEDEIEKETQIYEKGNSVLFGNISHDIVTTPFLKKYISYAKKASNPTLNDDAIDFIAQAYKSLRQKAQDVQYANQKKLPVTVRSLETLIRLATAHSKLRINNEGMVTTDDLQVALKLMNFAIFDEDDDEEGGEEDVQYQDKQETVDDSESVEEPRMGRRKPRKTGQSLDTVIDLEEEDDEERIDTKPQKKNKKKLKVDDVQQVRNLVDFSANSKEDMLYRERKKLVYTLLSKKQKDEVFDLNYDQIWNILSSKPETLELMGSKENLIQIVHAFEKSNQVLITDDGAIVLI